jgi:hypothetical protein
MAQLLFDLLPTALSAAVEPMLLVVMLLILAAAKKPVQSGLALWCGGLVYFLLVSGVVLWLVGSQAGEAPHAKPTWRLVLDVGLGVLFVVLAVQAGWAKPDPEKAAKLHKRITDLASRSPLQVFVAGLLIQVAALKSLAFLVVALKQITGAQVGMALGSLALLVYLLIAFAPYELPLLLYLAVPQRAGALVGRVNTWLQEHHKAVTVLVDLFIAYLLFKAAISG